MSFVIVNCYFLQFILATLGYGTNQSKTTLLELEKRNNISRDDGRDGYSMVNPFSC